MTSPIEKLITEAYANRRTGDKSGARTCAEAALQKARKGDDQFLLARALMTIGQIERDEGKWSTAHPHYKEAVSVFRRAGDGASLAHAIRHLGDLETELGSYEAAEAAYAEALSLYDTLNNVSPLTRANALRAYAVLHDRTGRADAARELWSRARALYVESDIEAGVDECDARLAQKD